MVMDILLVRLDATPPTPPAASRADIGRAFENTLSVVRAYEAYLLRRQ
jgi:hypothetical protein